MFASQFVVALLMGFLEHICNMDADAARSFGET